MVARALPFAVILLVVTGCGRPAAEPPPPLPVEIISGPDGKPAALISCANGPRYCFQVAATLCPTGYNVLDRESRVLGTRGSGKAYAYRAGNSTIATGSGSSVTDTESTLFVSCPGIAENRERIEANRARKAREHEKRCGYTCTPGSSCPYLDENGCYRREFDVPEQ